MDENFHKLIRLADTISMREMDRHAIEDLGIPGVVLMENAARSVADWLVENKLKNEPDSRIVICCGKGNNGGDGFAIARLLANRGYDIYVVDAGDAKKGDARKNQLLWEQFGESTSFPDANATRRIEEADVLIDAIFGIGMEQSIEGAYREWIEIFNSNKTALRVAVDIPSGFPDGSAGGGVGDGRTGFVKRKGRGDAEKRRGIKLVSLALCVSAPSALKFNSPHSLARLRGMPSSFQPPFPSIAPVPPAWPSRCEG